jgi:hypothetical protein
MATEVQVFSEHEVDFGGYGKFFWTWSGDNSVVPAGKTLARIFHRPRSFWAFFVGACGEISAIECG